MAKPTNAGPDAGAVAVIGTVKRVLKCTMGDAQRVPLDDELHELMDAAKGVERQTERAKKAVAKLKARGTAIDEQLDELHARRKETEIEAVVVCNVERSPSELRIVRTDTQLVIARRPLTKDETTALGAQLPGMTETPKIRHPELEPDGAVAKLVEREGESAKERRELLKPVTLEAVFREIDEEEEGGDDEEEGGDEPPPEPKGKRPKKGKKQVNQPELPLKGKK